MLKIVVPEKEMFDESTNEFFTVEEATLQLEHSLISLSKWEQKWHVPFMSKEEKTTEQIIDYIRCMTINPVKDDMIYMCLTSQNIEAINKYIDDPMTATTFSNMQNQKKSNNEIITNEIIYYWMLELNIPSEYAKWHLNHLLTLIQVATIKKTPPKKMNKKDVLKRNRSLNELRKKQYGTTG